MNDDNVRHLWSDAELDDALNTLNADFRTDGAELDHARAALLRAAAAESGRAYEAPAVRKKRPGSWRWIAVAAAVAVVTGGVVVAREVTEPPAVTVAPAATPQSDVRPGPGQYTHVTNTYTEIEWVAGLSAFAVREKVELWIPADPSDLWQRKWTRTGDATLLTGPAGFKTSLPDPGSATQVAPGGNFTGDFPHPGGWTTAVPAGWFRPTPDFVATLPTDPAELRKLLLIAGGPDRFSEKMASQPEQLLPPMESYPDLYQAPPPAGPTTTTTKTPLPPAIGSPASSYVGAGDAQMRPLTVLASGLASRPLRTALVNLLRSDASSVSHRGDLETLSYSYGNHELVATIDTATSQLVSARNVTTGGFYGIPAGQALSSASFGYEVTSEFGS